MNEKKTELIGVRTTKTVRANLKKQADERGCTVSQLGHRIFEEAINPKARPKSPAA